ncbi:transmembrane protein 215 [Latimeria chalumnae]|uniref:Transmembrane protein 215 n=1 Tax=Latimeria chalumnae TaxID=7897 RepID=H3AEG0_LATCH|nr:PREDICTED: transmembrane protein 215 [Latimeria chalumnae]|eukprot:XP_006009605.1 PREDICTED: transmembrane protein 215 [Latimeria chalumnae]
MRQDNINPRTGLVVALVSIFLVFGFMFTVSGIKGETLGDIPLIAIGPAICFPGVAAIVLAKKTDGCTKCPCGKSDCCKTNKEKEDADLLDTPWDLESGKGSCDELDKEGDPKGPRKGDDSVSSTTTTGESRSLIRRVDQDEVMRYLEACYPSSVFSGVRDVSYYCVIDRMCSTRDSVAYSSAKDNTVCTPRDSVVVYSHRDSGPYGRYCCYINPGELNWDQETIV